ncbi:GPP34 family phosphoprotein [Streptomyces sp. NPDC093516]|uniref:GOLPH3/VPS74 family protein n=1 Tax=Streptomyces sp. NPDC093516 TaxID=3155304 RepID=UPI00342DAB7F
MTTAHDLMLVALGMPGHSVEEGDLSLALAGAEALDLLEGGALTLDGDRLVPGPPASTGDRLLDAAYAALDKSEPYETVDDWLWRRGSELAATYLDDLWRKGLITQTHGQGIHLWPGPACLADSPARQAAEERRRSGEPLLSILLSAAGIGEEPADIPERVVGEAVTTVLAAVGESVTQLEALRLRRDIENAAFDNVWRGY